MEKYSMDKVKFRMQLIQKNVLWSNFCHGQVWGRNLASNVLLIPLKFSFSFLGKFCKFIASTGAKCFEKENVYADKIDIFLTHMIKRAWLKRSCVNIFLIDGEIETMHLYKNADLRAAGNAKLCTPFSAMSWNVIISSFDANEEQ